MKRVLEFWMILCLLISFCGAGRGEVVGSRPYEMIWADRTEEAYPPLIDFEDVSGWSVSGINAEGKFEGTREKQLWDDFVGKVSYRASGDSGGSLMLRPERPVSVEGNWDAFSLWIWGNTYPNSPEAGTEVQVRVLFQNGAGEEVEIPLGSILWKEWFLVYRVLTPKQRERLGGKVAFTGFRLTNIRNAEEKVLYFDNFAVFEESREIPVIPPRPKRGIPMLADNGSGFNTGEGTLPFPNRNETILPTNLAVESTSEVRKEGETVYFEYRGTDGKLTYRYRPESGSWSDVAARWNDGDWFYPLRQGGIRLWNGNSAVIPEKLEQRKTEVVDGEVVSTWVASGDGVSQEVTYRFRLWGKSLVIDTVSKGGGVAEVLYGGAEGVGNREMVWNPFMHYNSLDDRPGVVILGTEEAPLFMAGNTDWYLSNASEMFGRRTIESGIIYYQGGTRYLPMTDGRRNDCYERFFLTIAPAYEEVLPDIPNPVSPWRKETAGRVWTARGAGGDRSGNRQYFERLHRYGIRDLAITDHETMWRDREESFTFRTRTAPGKGGDESQERYTRFLQDELGFLYGPYNNFTDFAPVNEFWTPDLISRKPDNQLLGAWHRCYAPKPALAVDFAERLPPIIQEKFNFGTAYCDVHTAVSPWSRTDYDARIPGAGTFAATYYAFGEILLLQKRVWRGPVYSEGKFHWFYAGLADGNYGQDPAANLTENPWLVDFNLRKIHPLNNNFGMGNPSMFFGRRNLPETDEGYDQFLAAQIAFGHTGFLLPMQADPTLALRSYYMPLKLHSRYGESVVKSIRYADDRQILHETSQAVINGAFRNSQIVTEYEDGTVTIVNGSPEKEMHASVGGRSVRLPPFGYAGWSADGKVQVYSGELNGHRIDYSESDSYIFIDGRGKFTRMKKVATDGPAILRRIGEGEFEIISVNGANCGFAVTIDSAEALDEAGKPIGEAKWRVSRELSYLEPVEGAFSYRVKGKLMAPESRISAPFFVLPGQRVELAGGRRENVTIPADLKVGEHYWRRTGSGEWIDFLVSSPFEAGMRIEGDRISVGLINRTGGPADVQIRWEAASRNLRLGRDGSGTVWFPILEPEDEGGRLVDVSIRTANHFQKLQRVLFSSHDRKQASVELPPYWSSGIHSGGADEPLVSEKTGAIVTALNNIVCGGVQKSGIFMHPPYKSGKRGTVFIEYEPILLPKEPVVFRAVVGKRDRSDPGDGVVFRLEVKGDGIADVAGEESVVSHEWRELVADLAKWAGKNVRLRLVADPGPRGDTSGDWAAVAEPGLFDRERVWSHRLSDETEPYLREPGPYSVNKPVLAQLRSARKGWLHYEGIGLNGGEGRYGSGAVFNGESLGPMAPAAGNEIAGKWAEAKVALTPEAISGLKSRGNRFEIDNHGRDFFAIRGAWIELELSGGRKISSQVSPAAYTQPQDWLYGVGIKVPFDRDIVIEIDF